MGRTANGTVQTALIMIFAVTEKGKPTMTERDREIIRGMAECNMNASLVAKKQFWHRNTIVYHIQRVKEETGLDAMVFYDLVKLLERIDGEDE